MHLSLTDACRTRVELTAALGFRRVESVHVHQGVPAVAEVTGVTHRYPRTIRVSLDTAARLAKCGVPLHLTGQRSVQQLRRSA